MKSHKDILRAAYDKIDYCLKNKGKLLGIPSGFSSLDNITNGWQKGNSIVIAARPGKGKTAFALNLMDNAARKGHKCGMISLEMNDDEKGIRYIASNSGVSINDMMKGWITPEDSSKIVKAIARDSSLPIMYAYNVRDIYEMQKSMINMIENGAELIIIDHIQLVKNRRESRRVEVEDTSRTIKEMANKYRIPIIILCQLKRGEDDKEPTLSSLKESGAIEEDADVVLFIHHLPEINSDYSKNVKLIVGKGRNIQMDVAVEFTYFGMITKFVEKLGGYGVHETNDFRG